MFFLSLNQQHQGEIKECQSTEGTTITSHQIMTAAAATAATNTTTKLFSLTKLPYILAYKSKNFGQIFALTVGGRLIGGS